MKTPQGLPFGMVIWNDACQFENPVTLQDLGTKHRPEVMHTVGWILREDETGVTVANEFYDESFRGTSFIPRAMVTSVTYLKLVKPRKGKLTVKEG